MLVLTLERRRTNIVLDTVMREGVVTHNSGKINKKCYEYYTRVFIKWKAAFDKLTSEWKAEYEPLSDIDQEIYTSVTTVPAKEELKWIVVDLPNGKAAGPSGIPYKLLKKAKKPLQKWLRLLFSIILITGIYQNEWRFLRIFSISKPQP